MKNLSLILTTAVLSALALYSQIDLKNTNTFSAEMTSSFKINAQKFNIKFSSPEEENYRLSVFNQSFNLIQEINSNPELTFKAGVNKLAYMTDAEIKIKFLGARISQEGREILDKNRKIYPENNLKSSIDWRTKNVIVDEVQDQKDCGACWAFQALGPSEGSYNQKYSPETPRKFSEQQLLDCATDREDSCETGENMFTPFTYMENSAGLTDLHHYPYVAVRSDKCDTQRIINPAGFVSHSSVGAGANRLRAALNQNIIAAGFPVSRSWALYQGGIFNDSRCELDLIGLHAIIVTGYDQDAGYFTIKNSWGADWGDKGYIKMAMPRNNWQRGPCGIVGWGPTTIRIDATAE